VSFLFTAAGAIGGFADRATVIFERGVDMSKVGTVVIVMALAASACGGAQDQGDLEEQIADLERQLEEASASSDTAVVDQVVESTSSTLPPTTTSSAPTPADLVLPYFEALADGDWLAAQEASSGHARQYAEFWAAEASVRLAYSVRESSVTITGEDTLEVCTDSLNPPYDYEIRCLVISDLAFAGGQVSGFSFDGQRALATKVTSSEGTLQYGGEGELILNYKWGAVGPAGTIALFETSVVNWTNRVAQPGEGRLRIAPERRKELLAQGVANQLAQSGHYAQISTTEQASPTQGANRAIAHSRLGGMMWVGVARPGWAGDLRLS
jgi:hypothetical protein